MRFEHFSFFLITLGLSLLFALWYYYDRRQKRFLKKERLQTVFHCIKCNQLYAVQDAVEISECPSCGFKNDRLQF
ncbi:MAG: hydrogenase nickel incorporation protein HypA [Puniceicoccaceae bacterium]|nr:hydrogenase nickel incorporation protein HypA [Puniceicoccaceae bacterium]RCL31872.1 MAG: hydrogenase nickel incorporation protein HypA [Puniceicoccaceae bacterium]